MNITELKELAEKATPGPWELETYDEKLGWVISNQSIFADCAYVTSEDTARFIAAANPAEILDLIAKLEDAQGEIRALRATEAGLRERVKELTAIVDGFVVHGFTEDRMSRARALLEKKE